MKVPLIHCYDCFASLSVSHFPSAPMGSTPPVTLEQVRHHVTEVEGGMVEQQRAECKRPKLEVIICVYYNKDTSFNDLEWQFTYGSSSSLGRKRPPTWWLLLSVLKV